MIHATQAPVRRRRHRQLPLTLAVFVTLYGGQAFAQQLHESDDDSARQSMDDVQANDDAPESTSPKQLDAVTVTGSLLRRADYENTSPIQTINISESSAQGSTSLANVLQRSALGSASTQITNQFGNFVIDGGLGVQTFSLRGLGANRTLMLLNGQRPGPSGVRGAVGSFDLNVLPMSLLHSAEIVKDGASSIYGSDAIAGAVNLITRRDIARPELHVLSSVPLAGGGESYNVSMISGWTLGNGNIVVAGDVYRQNAMAVGERDYLRCTQPRVRGNNGESLDIRDHSVLAGSSLAGCQNMLIDLIVEPGTPNSYVPSPDGVVAGPFPGRRPNRLQRHADGVPASNEQVNNFQEYGQTHIINQNKRATGYVAADFSFGSVNWQSQWLASHRETEHFRWRQFFPTVSAPGTRFNLAQPVMPLTSRSAARVTYLYGSNRFDGLIGGTDTWAWQANVNYSHSRGSYANDAIITAKTGDLSVPDGGVVAADYLDRGFLSGERAAELKSLIGGIDKGSTIYTQATVNALFTGELMDVPAGAVGAAFGLEYRNYSIDDQPSQLARTGSLWSSSTAQVTRGRDNVVEGFAEIEVPVIKGIPWVESLTVNGSGRVFRYDTVGSSDNVWKFGLNWQLNSVLRLRASTGTSYRAPGLFELYLGNETGFVNQQDIDPCIRWGESSNDFLRANCAKDGIADDFNGAANSALVYSGGGAGELTPERSRSRSVGLVLTPTFADMNIAVDYFDYDIRDEIAQLGSDSIVAGCYLSPVHPNRFCDQFNRSPDTGDANSHAITEIRSRYLNINRQRARGYDLSINGTRDFGIGSFELETRATYTLTSVERLFSTAEASGLLASERVGSIGRPKITASTQLSFRRGDWTARWLTDYIGGTRNLDLPERFTYLRYENARRDIHAESRLYHTASLTYSQADWSVMIGMRNIFDRAPPAVSNGVSPVVGNAPAFSTQYDLLGRTGFAHVTYKF